MAGDLLREFELLMGCAKYCQDIPRPLRPRQSQIDENKDPCSEMAACCALPPLIGCGDCRPHSDCAVDIVTSLNMFILLMLVTVDKVAMFRCII